MAPSDSALPDELARNLWRLAKPHVRGPKPAHSVDDVVAIAIAIADGAGLDAVSMKEIAQHLKLTKMAVYRYVTSRSELVSLMIEMAIGDPPDLSRVRGGWRSALTAWARHQRTTWLSHPWLPDASNWQSHHSDATDRLLGPNELSMMETAVAALAGTGLSHREVLESVFLIGSYNRHALHSTTGHLLPWHADTGLDAQTAAELQREFGDDFPHLENASRSSAGPANWDFGLRCLLDGISAAIDRKSR